MDEFYYSNHIDYVSIIKIWGIGIGQKWNENFDFASHFHCTTSEHFIPQARMHAYKNTVEIPWVIALVLSLLVSILTHTINLTVPKSTVYFHCGQFKTFYKSLNFQYYCVFYCEWDFIWLIVAAVHWVKSNDTTDSMFSE